jgi:cytochrome P450 family 130
VTERTLEYRPFGRDTWRDPYPLYRRLRDEDPVHRSPGGYWVLTQFQHVFDAARDTVTFSSAHGLTFDNEGANLGVQTMVFMDPPEHTRYRRLVSRGFTPRNVEALEPALRLHVRSHVQALRNSGSGDFVAGLARPIPSWVVAHYLGVPEEDRFRFDQWTQAIVQASYDAGMTAAGAVADLSAYFMELVEVKRHSPGDDVVSDLIRADDEGHGIGLEGILGMAFVMIAGGNDTTTGLLAGAAELLTTFPDQRQRLIDDPSLIPNAVDELLRLTSPVQGLCRVALRDADIGRTAIASGDRVLLCYASANRDEREFGDDAAELDVGRKIQRFVTFGVGSHFCLGAAATRLQGRIVLEELLSACPGFAVDAANGVFADGGFTRRYESLPFDAGSA